MVKINFKLTGREKIEYSLVEPETLDTVLQKCTIEEGLKLGGYIAVRGGTVIATSTLIEDGDEIDVFPAISGG